MVALLQFFPYPKPREIQAQALEVLGREWDRYDVFVISAPTAFGKTALAKTLMNALGEVSVITPTNMLVNQFREEFPDTPTLARLDSYTCEEWRRPCSVTRGKLKSFCKGCPAGRDLATARFRRGPGVYNYHIALAHKLYRETLVVDEAHNLIPFIRDRLSQRIWQHDYRYPGNMFTIGAMAEWVRKLAPNKRRHQKIQALEDAVLSARPGFMPKRGKEWYNGKGTIRGEPEERDCLRLLPVDIRGAPPFFWPRDVQKLVLLSATISPKDIQTLGLDRKRVLYINCESPIPAGHRPIVSHPVTTVNRLTLDQATRDIGEYIDKILAPAHTGQKGLIHATYQQAAILAECLAHRPRYLFHNRDNKSSVYARFRESSAGEGLVLVASGMYEGVDLPEDLGRWQAIAKIPWPSLGNPAIKHQADRDPDWYTWETLRIVMQACGRICRTPEDFGVTYCLDSSFARLIREGKERQLIPEWFLDGITAGGGL